MTAPSATTEPIESAEPGEPARTATATATATATDQAPPVSVPGRRRRAVGTIALVIGLCGVGAFAVVGNADTCSGGGTVTLRVGATPDIEGAVAQAVQRFNDARNDIGGTCVQAETAAAEPAQVAAAMLGQARAGSAEGPAAPLDVWIPDSSLWASLVPPGIEGRNGTDGGRAVGATETSTSLAQTPIVVVASQDVAAALRGQGMPPDPSWEDLLTTPDQPPVPRPVSQPGPGPARGPGGQQESPAPASPARLQVADPARNATGLATLVLASQLRVGNVGGAGDVDDTDEASDADESGGLAAYTDAARAVRADTAPAPDTAAGLAALQAAGQGQPTLVVAPEQAVVAYNQANPAQRAYSFHPRGGTLMLDYPYLVTTTDPARAEGARMLETEIRSEQSQAGVRALGFRSADGTPPAALGPDPGPAPQPRPAPPAAEVRNALQAWRLEVTGTRTLAVFDITASMGEDLGPGLTRLQAATQAAEATLALLPDTAETGTWLFAHRLAGNQDWAELVTVGRLGDAFGPATRRQQTRFGLAQIRPIPEARAGLYGTILAAFRTMNRTYDPERANTVLLFTDGTDDAPGAIPLPDLLTALRAEYDPTRPVHLAIVGYGDGVDRGALEQITAATRGSTYLATTPEQTRNVQDVLLADLTRHPSAH